MILVLTLLARARAEAKPPGAMIADDPDAREEHAPVPDPATTPPPEAPPSRQRTGTARRERAGDAAAADRHRPVRPGPRGRPRRPDRRAARPQRLLRRNARRQGRRPRVRARTRSRRMIGPSGCGKSTLVRCINRMHEEIPGARAEGVGHARRHRHLRPDDRRHRGAPRRSAWSSRSRTRSRRCRSSTTSPPACG